LGIVLHQMKNSPNFGKKPDKFLDNKLLAIVMKILFVELDEHQYILSTFG
jgi:hypothetical protein